MSKEIPNFINPNADKAKEYIICAAILYEDGMIYEHQPKNILKGIVVAGRRHHNCIMTYSMLTGFIADDIKLKQVQGFITSKDYFVNRTNAMLIAIEAGQVKKEGNEGTQLFSEDLY